MERHYYDGRGTTINVLAGFAPNHMMVCAVETHRDYRLQGGASRLLRQICHEADEEGITLVLSVDPSPGLNALPRAALRAFYSRCGFRTWPYGGPGAMRRKPGTEMVRLPQSHNQEDPCPSRQAQPSGG